MEWLMTGGRRLADGGFAEAELALSGGVVAEAPAASARRIDASGLLLVPGICDVHGDGFERNLSPRPGVFFDIATALLETDRQLVANGVTTAFLAVTVSWEPGLRSLEMAERLMAALDRLRPDFATDIRVQLRWETYALDAVDRIEAWLRAEPKPVLAFNDHLTGLLKGDRLLKRLPEYAARAGLSAEEYRALLERTAARKDEIPDAMARLAAVAREAGVAVFAHDERTPEERRHHRALGVTVSEFPLTAETAREAVEADEPTVLGAPNVLRGGSHIGAVDAGPAIAAGLCSVLASDYYYPAQLQAVAKLGGGDEDALARHWPLVSGNAARAAGLADRGSLRPGARGDVLALRLTRHGLRVEAAFAGGRLVHLADGARLG